MYTHIICWLHKHSDYCMKLSFTHSFVHSFNKYLLRPTWSKYCFRHLDYMSKQQNLTNAGVGEMYMFMDMEKILFITNRKILTEEQLLAVKVRYLQSIRRYSKVSEELLVIWELPIRNPRNQGHFLWLGTEAMLRNHVASQDPTVTSLKLCDMFTP